MSAPGLRPPSWGRHGTLTACVARSPSRDCHPAAGQANTRAGAVCYFPAPTSAQAALQHLPTRGMKETQTILLFFFHDFRSPKAGRRKTISAAPRLKAEKLHGPKKKMLLRCWPRPNTLIPRDYSSLAAAQPLTPGW